MYGGGLALSYDEDEELKKLLAKRRMELERALAEQRQKEEKMKIEAEREAILRSILTEEARERLARLKLARPELVKVIEDQLIMLAQSGRLSEPLDDEQLKEILRRMSARKREGEIIFKRKGGVD